MFKHPLVLGSLAILPRAAMGGCVAPDSANTVTLSVPTGQAAPLTITFPSHASAQQSAQAPFALTGESSVDAPHQYRLMVFGQGGFVQVPTNWNPTHETSPAQDIGLASRAPTRLPVAERVHESME